MRLDAWTIALQTVNFAVLVWLLHRYLYKPVLAMVDARRAEIEQRYDAVRTAEDQAQTRLAAIATERAGIAAERDAALKTAAAHAQEAAEVRQAGAERAAQALLGETRKTLEVEREHALQEARSVALELAATLAQRLLAEVPMQLRAEAWLERIERHIRELSDSERDGLIHPLLQSGSLTVVTAAPLTPPIAELWRQRMRKLLGDGVRIEFAVDENLIAGAELHFPTAILRFSWQMTLAEMRSEVGIHADAH